MDIIEYIDQKKEMQSLLLNFIDSEKYFEEEFNQLVNFLNSINIQSNNKELVEFLYLISKVSSNHHRSNNFFAKIEKVLSFFENVIKQTFSKSQIFDIFQNNKRILIFLVDQNILDYDSQIEKALGPYAKNDDQNELKFYKENQKVGENESQICQYIRNDLVEDFISHVQRSNIPLSSEIKYSIFETNPLLTKKKTTLIEYATFFGSIQIFNYLSLNEVKLGPSLWIYAIHSNNGELFHLLEEFNVDLPDDWFQMFLKEAIKCHHNDIANYILNNKIDNKNTSFKFKRNILAYCYRYHNYEFFPTDFENEFIIAYLCKYNYYKLVEFFLEDKKIDLEKKYFAKKNNYDIINLILSKQAKTIPDFCFNNCTKLTEVKIPINVISIGENAFSNCSSLKEVTISSSCLLKKIGKNAFEECSSLKRITIPSSVDLIDTNAFGRCSSLEEVVIESPSQLNSIQGCAFNQCTSLTHFSFPSSISMISFRLFYGCEKLVEITIPSSVTSIEDHAFCGCSSLEKVTFESPSQLNEIKSKAFYECSSLFEIKIPSTVSLIEKEVFMNCFSLKQVIFDDQSPLEKLSESIFSGCKSLEKVNVPQKVTKIEKNAFRFCLSLSQINLPPLLDEIGDCAFYCCKSMRQITIPDSVSIIGEMSFSGCKSLTFIKIPDKLSIIKKFTFEGCISLQQVIIPQSVNEIGQFAFNRCVSLNELTIPSSVKIIGAFAFERGIKLNIISPHSTKFEENFSCFSVSLGV